ADKRLAATARRRYARFAVERAPDVSIEVGAAGDAHDPDETPRVDETGDRAYAIRYGALEAAIDLARRKGTAKVPLSVHVLDSLLRMTMSLVLLEHDALLLHASGVLREGGAHVYFGPSGV